MKHIILFAGLALLSACDTAVQTTSGSAFLAARSGPIDDDIAAAAVGEPNLHFPARIGIARIDARSLIDMSASEKDAMQTLVSASQSLGDVVFVTDFGSSFRAADPIKHARKTAAQQHLDYVLVYQLVQNTRGLSARGEIKIAFVDVRNGYVYGRHVEDASLAGLGYDRQGWGHFAPSDRGAARLIETALPDVADMLNQLTARALR